MPTNLNTCLASLLLVLTANFLNLADADVVTDQSNEQGTINFFVDDLQDLAQTFTVGIDGQLTDVELFIGRNSQTVSDLIFDVRSVMGLAPSESDVGGNILASATIAANSVSVDGMFQVIDISDAGLNVSAGETLALTLRTEDQFGYRWLATDNGEYTRGESFSRGSGNFAPQPFSRAIDQSFRTRVEPTAVVPVPEPTMVFPSVIACLLLSGRRRRTSL